MERREEIMVGNAGEGKPDSHGSKAIDTAESRLVAGAITLASHSLHASTGS